MAQRIQDVCKLKSLGIMLGIESGKDWDYIVKGGPLEARTRLADRWIKISGRRASWEELERIMMQPALKEIRIARDIRQNVISRGYSNDSGITSVVSISSSLSSTTGIVPVQYQNIHIGIQHKAWYRPVSISRESVILN